MHHFGIIEMGGGVGGGLDVPFILSKIVEAPEILLQELSG